MSASHCLQLGLATAAESARPIRKFEVGGIDTALKTVDCGSADITSETNIDKLYSYLTSVKLFFGYRNILPVYKNQQSIEVVVSQLRQQWILAGKSAFSTLTTSRHQRKRKLKGNISFNCFDILSADVIFHQVQVLG